jgi:hypothetical protein
MRQPVHARPWRAGSCSGASRRPPWGCRSCRRCNTSRTRRLVDVLGPVEAGRLVGDELVVVVHALDVLGRPAAPPGLVVDRAVDDDVFDRRQVGQQPAERLGQRVVDDDDPVVGVRRDIDDLRREEPDVEGVQHRAHRRHREIGDEVLGVVPHERRDPLVAGDAQAAQRVRELGGLLADLGEGRCASTLSGPRDDLLLGVDGGAVAQQLTRSAGADSAWCSSCRKPLISGPVTTAFGTVTVRPPRDGRGCAGEVGVTDERRSGPTNPGRRRCQRVAAPPDLSP